MTDSSAPNSPELTRLSGEQAEERTAREGRKDKRFPSPPYYVSVECKLIPKAVDKELTRLDTECSRLASRVAELEADVTRWQLLAGKLDCKKCTPGLASRVEELEKLLFDAQYFAKYARQRMLDAGQNGDVAQADGWLKKVAKLKADRGLAGAHAEERE